MLLWAPIAAMFAACWWQGPAPSGEWGVVAGLVVVTIGALLTRLRPTPRPWLVGLSLLLAHVAAGAAAVAAGLPIIEFLKLLLQGTVLAAAGGLRAGLGRIPLRAALAALGVPLALTGLRWQQAALEGQELARLQAVVAATAASGHALPDRALVGDNARAWTVDRASARIVASSDGSGGDLESLGLAEPGRVLTELAGGYASHRAPQGIVVWQAVLGLDDVGVALVVSEPLGDFSQGMVWELALLTCVVGAVVVLAGRERSG